jgi:Family of unknown function (DUF6459)
MLQRNELHVLRPAGAISWPGGSGPRMPEHAQCSQRVAQRGTKYREQAVRSSWTTVTADSVAEVSASFRRAARVAAPASRLQGIDGRWRLRSCGWGEFGNAIWTKAVGSCLDGADRDWSGSGSWSVLLHRNRHIRKRGTILTAGQREGRLLAANPVEPPDMRGELPHDVVGVVRPDRIEQRASSQRSIDRICLSVPARLIHSRPHCF